MRRRGTRWGDFTDDRRLMAGFVCLVGLSSATMAAFGGGSLAVVGLAAVAGLVVGSGLLWYLRWIVR